jgi:PAS domain S-box-containing protein
MRYFFHFMVGDSRLDDDLGLDCASPDEARAEAVCAAREVIADLLRRNEPVPADGAVEITDDRGRIVESLDLAETAFSGVPASRYRRIFENAAQACLLLAPDLTIVEANRAYLRATMVDPAGIARRPLFEVFPDNPADPDADGVRNLSASLEKVLREKVRDVMPVQRYDIRRPDGTWEVRYWKPSNVPILDRDGEVEFIVHSAEDVTLSVRQATRTAG